MCKIITVIAALHYCLAATAQLAVRDEPRHHNVFANDYVRILDVFLAPGDTTLYHLHNTPSVFIPFTKTTTETQLSGEAVRRGTTEIAALWYDSLVTPRVHRVWNVDSNWFHVMDIELVNTKPAGEQPVLQAPYLELLYKEQRTNVYRLHLIAGKDLRLPPSTAGYLIISFGDADIRLEWNGAIQHRMMKAAHYVWIEAGLNATITSISNGDAGFAILQLN